MSSYDLDLFDATCDLNDHFPGVDAYIHYGAFGTKEIRLKADPGVHINLIEDPGGCEWHIIKGSQVAWGDNIIQAMNSFLEEEC